MQGSVRPESYEVVTFGKKFSRETSTPPPVSASIRGAVEGEGGAGAGRRYKTFGGRRIFSRSYRYRSRDRDGRFVNAPARTAKSDPIMSPDYDRPNCSRSNEYSSAAGEIPPLISVATRSITSYARYVAPNRESESVCLSVCLSVCPPARQICVRDHRTCSEYSRNCINDRLGHYCRTGRTRRLKS